MEKSRFDAMARLLGGAASRRTALKTLAAVVAAGGITASMVADDVAAGEQAPPRPRTCRYPGYYCTKNSHCCSEDGCTLGPSIPRRERNRCTCVQNDEGRCFRDSDCCNYRNVSEPQTCQVHTNGIGYCKVAPVAP